MEEMWSQLNTYSDGEPINAENLNVPISQLGDRTDYLKARLKKLTDGDKMSAVILSDVDLSSEEGRKPSVGNVVYLDDDNKFSAAKAKMSLYDDFTAAESSFTVGILISDENGKGDVVVYGKIDLAVNGIGISDILESGETYRKGRYYLSSNEAGKLTANPNGPVVYVCTVSDVDGAKTFSGTALVNPQFLDIGQSHVHRTAVLTARPAGYSSVEGYYPIKDNRAAVADADASSYPSLKFGGTWTSSKKVSYSFYLENGSAEWGSNGIELSWKEDGGNEKHSVRIWAPDEEVPLSNGLTVMMSLPKSNAKEAYSHAGKVEWSPLTFPDAGMGWRKHETFMAAIGYAEKASADDTGAATPTTRTEYGFRAMLRGSIDMCHCEIGVAFPSKVKTHSFTKIPESDFTYGDKTFRFTTSESSETSSSDDVVDVAIGTNVADTVLYLAEALNKTIEGNGTFVVFEKSENAADLLVLDGEGEDAADVCTRKKFPFDNDGDGASAGSGVGAVVFCVDDYKVLGTASIVRDIASNTWKDIGNGLKMIVYRADPISSDVYVEPKAILYGTWNDDEHDAVYDYVLGLDTTVAKYWPPVPPKSAALMVNGVEMDNKALVPDRPTVSFGKDTIHWFADEDAKRPWPMNFVNRDTDLEDLSHEKTEILHWVRGFQGATGPVTSLKAKEGSPIKVYGYGTFDTANTGDLEIDADLDFKIVDGGASGYMVPKRVTNGQLVAGPVVERIIGGSGVSVVSQSGCPDGQGAVVIALDNGAYHSQFSDIALENAEQAKIGMFPYIRLKGYTNTITSPSAFTATMRVPTNLPDGNYELAISAAVFGESGFSGESAKKYARVKFSYNILPDFKVDSSNMKYKDLKSTLLVPDSDRTVDIPFGHQSDDGVVYNGFDPVHVSTDDDDLVESDDVVSKAFGNTIPSEYDFALQKNVIPDLRPGYLVGIRISRTTMTSSVKSAYTGPLGFINLSWSLKTAGNYSSSATDSSNADSGLYAYDTTKGLYHRVTALYDDDMEQETLAVDQTGVILK